MEGYKIKEELSILSELLMQFKDYDIGVQYFNIEFAMEMREDVGWCGIATINGETILTSGYETPIKAVLECIKVLKEKRGDFKT